MENAAKAVIKLAFCVLAAIALLFETGAVVIGVTMISNGAIFGVALVIVGLGTLIATVPNTFFALRRMKRSWKV